MELIKDSGEQVITDTSEVFAPSKNILLLVSAPA